VLDENYLRGAVYMPRQGEKESSLAAGSLALPQNEEDKYEHNISEYNHCF
jgi:hypothetical protein